MIGQYITQNISSGITPCFLWPNKQVFINLHTTMVWSNSCCRNYCHAFILLFGFSFSPSKWHHKNYFPNQRLLGVLEVVPKAVWEDNARQIRSAWLSCHCLLAVVHFKWIPAKKKNKSLWKQVTRCKTNKW